MQKLEVLKFNVTDAKISELSEQFMSLIIKGIDDKEGFKAVYSARQTVKALRVEVEKTRKALVEDAVKYQRDVNGEAKRISEQLTPIEQHLQGEEDKIESEKLRIKKEAEDREIKRVQARIDALSKYGFAVDYNEVKLATDAEFEAKLSDAKIAYEAEQLRQQNIKQEQEIEAERLAKERKELEELRAQQREAQSIIDAENDRIREEQAEAQRKIDEEKRQLQIELKKAEAVKEARLQAIEDERNRIKEEQEYALRQLQLAPDKEKLQALADKIIELNIFELKDEKAIKIFEATKELLNKTHAYLLLNLKSL
jgi:hypothetical protein